MHVVGICTTMPGLHSEIFTRGGKSGKVRIKRGQAYIGQENTNLQGCTLGSRGGWQKHPVPPPLLNATLHTCSNYLKL